MLAITWCSHDPVVWPRDQVGRFPGKFKTFTKCFLMDILEHTLESSTGHLKVEGNMVSNKSVVRQPMEGKTDQPTTGLASIQYVWLARSPPGVKLDFAHHDAGWAGTTPVHWPKFLETVFLGGPKPYR
ncbi:hypothetical protein ANN_20292 [Periplaneta americana]|uniref:Uncharacterized protein n=1 Tax=Periplaneta americana TaxID=6978 RepID=A0ABQ8SCX6_PERAM|nr:hypothetical protein ANN_20292 [Periplaneta americana]